MKNLDEELDECFEDNDFPEPDLSKLDRFDEKLAKNKEKRKKVLFIRRTISACMLFVLCLAVIIPIVVKNLNKEVVRYYGDDDVSQVEVTQEFAQSYINQNIPNYNFIFEDCEIISQYGIYDKETNSKLLALRLQVSKNEIPYTNLNINIILNKNYTYSKHSEYTKEAAIENRNNIKIYTIEKNDTTYALYTLLERSSYNTYLQLNINDTDILEKFKN